MTYSELGLRLLLGILAFYHLMIGILSTVWPERAARVSATLYALELELSPQMRYAVRMLGVYALAFGYLLSVATMSPAESPSIIRSCIVLLLLRAACRIGCSDELTLTFGVSRDRNLIHAALLVGEAVMLLVLMP